MAKSNDKIAQEIVDLKEHYKQQSRKERKVWIECYKNYINYTPELTNPYLSDLFIPKTHEAIELMSAFLIGKNQTIDVSPKNKDDVEAANFMGTLIEYQWQCDLNARPKLITWMKQAGLFGNGFMKMGWDADTDKPFMACIGIDNIFMDYYTADPQKCIIIHRIIKRIEDVQNDDRYKNTANLVPMSESDIEESETKFSAFDKTTITPGIDQEESEETELLEAWNPFDNTVTTVGQTASGWKVLRRIPRPYKNYDGEEYNPFVKVKFKNSPLPNRAYDIGAIEPTLKIQKSYNEAANQFMDNAVLINDKMWIKRKSANIDPKTLQRRPGGFIEVNDIDADIRSEEVSDIKQSMFEMLSFLDNEFQQASAVSNLLKGFQTGGTATEAALGQQNVQTLIDMIDGNLKQAMSEIGMMLSDLNIQFMNKKQVVKLFENDEQMTFAEIMPEHIKGSYDINISSDRGAMEGKAVRQKQMLDMINILKGDPITMQKFPDALPKLYKLWLKEAGMGDVEDIFDAEDSTKQDNKEEPTGMGQLMEQNSPQMPNTGQGLTLQTPSPAMPQPGI